MSTVQADLYPSRQHTHPRWQERLDPVAWRTDAQNAPLSAEQLSRFERDGFLVLPNVFSAAEVALFKDELARMGEDPAVLESPTAIREPNSGALRSVFAIHRSNELFARVARDERTAGLVRYLLDGDIYVHQSRLNLKPGFKGQEFYWHSDFETWHTEDGLPRMRTISCSILLTDNHPWNGPLMLIPGSHRHYISCVGQTPENHYQQSLRRQEFGIPDEDSLREMVDRYGIEQATGPAGSVVLFDCNTLHGSGSNIAPSPRSNLFFVYNHVGNKPVEPFDGMPPRPEFVAERGPVEPLDIGPQQYL
ncbi:putative L-proline 4-hydroxylase [Pseudomonas saudimassiliensis]|uniref:Ectoine hydroxylase n=1 Tax=Pseudomonas saudimassiliensis TaxID=1461581 RepID=A0A078MMS2_9PSED|nr:putative L-proline 4-hydroxylase [Pseudomonas saudimassiliensis]CEF27486.1 putative L-proline 4-hydroxylase [Pseudomonas saudimassiliensis]